MKEGAAEKDTGPKRLTLIIAGRLDQLTGGYLYDRHVVAGLQALGVQVEVIGLDGRFPLPDDIARESLQRALGGCTDGATVVLDGLAASAMPEVVAVHRQRLDLVALIHHPLGDETGMSDAQRERLLTLECQTLDAVAGIIVTSPFTRRRLIELGIDDARIDVVEPGVEPVALSPAAGNPPRLLCIATLIPRKGQHLLVEALAGLAQQGWHCDLIGDSERDTAYATRLHDLITSHRLEARISLHGALPFEQLEAFWQAADVFVLPSFYEGYGMVVSEALAHGLPVVTTHGGALADTLPAGAGLQIAPGDSEALREALASLLGGDVKSRERYQKLREGAIAARETFADWSSAARLFHHALARLVAQGRIVRQRRMEQP
ncbi:glycosyltransferase family 4 protein [Kushneria aurantia]|uniref:Glycosyltransferase family 4 protein n=1 Tax=Kushneria aurantia TaxID=504092 RepID=A0ABV6FZ96_9GAMM|nr:glycosyltransferase family 4 protein [Kushneria aurantia]